jgi:hypothetical protein
VGRKDRARRAIDIDFNYDIEILVSIVFILVGTISLSSNCA